MTIARHEVDSVTVSEASSDAESYGILDRAARRYLKVTAAEFLAHRGSGQYPAHWDVADISRVEFFLPFMR